MIRSCSRIMASALSLLLALEAPTWATTSAATSNAGISTAFVDSPPSQQGPILAIGNGPGSYPIAPTVGNTAVALQVTNQSLAVSRAVTTTAPSAATVAAVAGGGSGNQVAATFSVPGSPTHLPTGATPVQVSTGGGGGGSSSSILWVVMGITLLNWLSQERADQQAAAKQRQQKAALDEAKQQLGEKLPSNHTLKAHDDKNDGLFDELDQDGKVVKTYKMGPDGTMHMLTMTQGNSLYQKMEPRDFTSLTQPPYNINANYLNGLHGDVMLEMGQNGPTGNVFTINPNGSLTQVVATNVHLQGTPDKTTTTLYQDPKTGFYSNSTSPAGNTYKVTGDMASGTITSASPDGHTTTVDQYADGIRTGQKITEAETDGSRKVTTNTFAADGSTKTTIEIDVPNKSSSLNDPSSYDHYHSLDNPSFFKKDGDDTTIYREKSGGDMEVWQGSDPMPGGAVQMQAGHPVGVQQTLPMGNSNTVSSALQLDPATGNITRLQVTAQRNGQTLSTLQSAGPIAPNASTVVLSQNANGTPGFQNLAIAGMPVIVAQGQVATLGKLPNGAPEVVGMQPLYTYSTTPIVAPGADNATFYVISRSNPGSGNAATTNVLYGWRNGVLVPLGTINGSYTPTGQNGQWIPPDHAPNFAPSDTNPFAPGQ